MDRSELTARDVVERSLGIAADICVFTNHNISVVELGDVPVEST